ncbi:right-handed parallel beta-helix repeat-containing protein [Paenibacillus ferrarius]|uniref:right-handed parallel beta-helix repeat-containing protein n=1 Tax=Paenibacillus ferrarius TaxID=1469647 RepID=UPI003D2E23CC
MPILPVYPGSPTAIQDAVNAANPGDVVLVHKGVYHETVLVPSGKDNLRIVSKEPHAAILDGKFSLAEAFGLEFTAGVEINGFHIKNYVSNGIRLYNGKSHRIMNNTIRHIAGAELPLGLFVLLSTGTLIVRNTIERIGRGSAGTGIQLNSGSSNWIIDNKLQANRSYGIQVVDSNHNAIAENHISRNRGDGILLSGSDNNLLLHNTVEHNRGNGIVSRSTNSLIVDSSMKENLGNGLLFMSNYGFAGFADLKNNRQSGIKASSDFNDMQENHIDMNGNYGVLIEAPHTANLVLENHFNKNEPRNLKDQGVDNTILQNRFRS